MSLTFCLWKDNPTLGYNTWMSQTELCIALCRKGWPPFKSFGNFLERGLSSRLNKEGLSVYLLRAGLCLGNGVHTLQEKCGKLTGFVSFHGGWCKLLQEIKDIVGGGDMLPSLLGFCWFGKKQWAGFHEIQRLGIWQLGLPYRTKEKHRWDLVFSLLS